MVAETRDLQRPFEQGSLLDRFEFVPAGGATKAEPPPAAGSLAADVRRTYASPASIFGTPLGSDALVKAKAVWFAQWSSWRLSPVPGSLAVTSRGAASVDLVLAMDYDCTPKDAVAPHIAGKDRVYLGLVKTGGDWHVSYETSVALP